jgi:hypothetical protein
LFQKKKKWIKWFYQKQKNKRVKWIFRKLRDNSNKLIIYCDMFIICIFHLILLLFLRFWFYITYFKTKKGITQFCFWLNGITVFKSVKYFQTKKRVKYFQSKKRVKYFLITNINCWFLSIFELNNVDWHDTH